MTFNNLKILGIVSVVCLFCYVNARHLRRLGDLGLAMELIDQQYVDEPDEKRLYHSAMKGMIGALDPYSSYISPELLKPFQSVLDQEFGGIGISLEGKPRREQMTVVSTLFDSPAFRAGIKPGDLLLAVNDQDVREMEFGNVSKLLRGREGTLVKLRLMRKGSEEPIDVSVTRALIEVESVLGDRRKENGKWEYRMQADSKIAYYRVEIFGEKTVKELETAIVNVKEDCTGIIIDLRDNTGGLLEMATRICDMFLDEGVIVSTRKRNNVIDDVYTATPGTLVANSVPISILINDQSASASEIVAACLQDHHRATVVGTRSFGKGSVQNVIPIEGGEAAVRLTTAYYYPPSGKLIHRRSTAKPEDEWGVKPDPGFEVEIDEEGLLKQIERLRDRADPLNGEGGGDPDGQLPIDRDPSLSEDPQLLRAIEAIYAAQK